MYIIVTAKKEIADEAKENGAKVYEDAQVTESTARFEVISYDEAEARVMKLMNSLAFKTHLKGYDYISYILMKCALDSKYHMKSMTKVIYPDCAKEFETTSSRVERALRHAIEISFEEVPKKYSQIFSRELKEEPTNSEFISMMSQYIRYSVAAV